MRFSELIAQKAASDPHFNVLTFVDINSKGDFIDETRSYSQLNDNAQQLAAGLIAEGVKPQDNIALMMNNHPEFVEGMLAAGLLACPFVPIDPRAVGEKLRYMLDFTDCTAVICADYCVDAILAIASQCLQLQRLVVVSTGMNKHNTIIGRGLSISDYKTLLAEVVTSSAFEAPVLDDSMFMMFTSGTSGKPKAVINSHRHYMALATSLSRLNLSAEDRLYTGLSLTHINAQNTLRNAIALQQPAVISRKFSKSRLWDICRYYRCTVFSLLGGMIPEIYAVAEQAGDADNPVKIVFSSGMPAAIWQRFQQRFGVTIWEGYGSTEGGGLSNPNGLGPVGSIGKPSPDWQAEILDEKGLPCPPRVEGEICFRRVDGQVVEVEYYKNPQASADKVRNGWLHMGDLGHKDEQGWFYFHHRVGGGVRKNGDFVNTALVESVLSQHPAINDVFVYGVAQKHNVTGEKTLVAAIVPNTVSTFDEAQFLTYCKIQLEKNDVPEIVQVLAVIPKTVSEKPLENACIELLN